MSPKLLIAGLALLPALAHAAETDRRHFPATARMPAGIVPGTPIMQPPFSASVLAGNTLYVSGTTDVDPATGKLAPTPEDGARVVLDNVRRAVTTAGLTMDDLVWVQVFCSDLANYAAFNKTYATYFKGPLPARAFLGVDHLLGGAHFEVMGIAVKPAR